MKRQLYMKRQIVFALALLMLSMTIITACGGKVPVGTGDQTTADSSATTDKPWEEMTMAERRALTLDDLPEKNMEGMKFRIFAGGGQEIGFVESSGDHVDTAVIRRNEKIAERFKVEFEYITTDSPVAQEFATITAAGLDEFDIALAPFTVFPAVAQQGFCYDWAELPYVDLDKPWYSQSAREALSVDGHTYTMVGDLNLTAMAYSYCIFWNLELAEDYRLDDIYTTVKEGKWTYDYLLTLANTCYKDNGDSVKSEADHLAFAGDPWSAVVTWQYAFDNPLYTEVDGIPQFTLNLEKQHDMVRKLNDLYWTAPGGYTKDWWAGDSAWKAGRLLATTGILRNYQYYNELDFKFAIIPYPKYDENQSEYYTMSDGAHTAMAVPSLVNNIENVSIIIEALNAESYKLVTPVYYEKVLMGKHLRDEKDIEMLEMIANSVVFDFGYAYNSLLDNISFQITKFISNNSNDTQSTYAAVERSNKTKSAEIIEAFRRDAIESK